MHSLIGAAQLGLFFGDPEPKLQLQYVLASPWSLSNTWSAVTCTRKNKKKTL